MLPEIGHFALVLACCLALWQAILPTLGLFFHRPRWAASAAVAARGQLGFLLVAYGCLTAAFILHDFSVAYVAENSNTKLPLLYRIAGVWGAHEGSLLLWSVMLAGWAAAVSLFRGQMPAMMAARVLAVMGAVSGGFLLFMLLTSNPFLRLSPPPGEGQDLNPVLQDFALAVHPPFLYMGYVGFSVAFAFAVAALWEGKMDSVWARWARPWTLLAWVFLTVGITLGSWWAYYELGWGGWWFWDPVENASLMPWLVGTALLHSLATTESRGAFKSWTALLALCAFSFCLLGAFLVRSGVLTSVHSFANDPARGVFILLLLALATGGALLLFAARAAKLRPASASRFVSRETGILLNNLFLTAAAATVLLGTLYPLILESLRLGKISVGAPYFNSVFLPLTAPLAALVGVGALARWKTDTLKRLAAKLSLPLILSVAAGLALPLLVAPYQWAAAAGVGLGVWIVLATMRAVLDRARRTAAVWGMATAHIGLAVFVVGATLCTVYQSEKTVVLSPGDAHSLGAYSFVFAGVVDAPAQNYVAQIGEVAVWRGDSLETTLFPEKRLYLRQQQPLTEAAIDASLLRDVYVSLGDDVGGGAWTVQLRIKPFVRWIWGGTLLMALGGLLAVADRRYRR